MKRPTAGPAGAPRPGTSGSILHKCPLLFEHLTCDTWDDGEHRELSTLTIFAQDGRWKLCLNNREEAKVAFVTGATPEEALASLEKDLARDQVDWRPLRETNGRKK